jgi:hypothetical protein
MSGIPQGSQVRAVIFANDPESQFPRGTEPIAQSLEVMNVTSLSGEWYNFSINFPASQNTVYWMGYYSDNFTRYYFDPQNGSISITSETTDESSGMLPNIWHYDGESTMSVYALYTFAPPQPSPSPTPTFSPTPNPTYSPTNTPTPIYLNPTPNPTRSPTPTPSQPVPTQTSTPQPTSTPTPTQTTATTLYRFGQLEKGKEFSSLRAPGTINLCNFTTPEDVGVIMQVSIYLSGIPQGSQVRAIIFENDPQTQFPVNGKPAAQSLEALNVTSLSGKWYTFPINFAAAQNTVYWLGYYSDNFTRYFFDENSESISITSEPMNESSSHPNIWQYEGGSTMSLHALYTYKPPQQPPSTPDSESPQQNAFQDMLPLMVLIISESVIAGAYQIFKKKDFFSKIKLK